MSDQMGPSSFPSALVPGALDILLRERYPAWARFDAQGIVIASGGDLARYGLDRLKPGMAGGVAVPALHGLLPLEGGGLHLPRMQLAGGWVDLELLPAEGDEVWLLALDVGASAEQERVLYQKGNELDLLRARWAGAPAPDGESEIATILGPLDLAVFERGPSGRLRPIGAVPGWTRSFLVEDESGVHLDRGDGLAFLDNFLIDAEGHWSQAGTGYLSSGMWSETSSSGSDCFYEAIAVRNRGGSGLVIQQLGSRYVERQRILQGAREARLDLEALRGEVQKKDILLHCIVHDLRGPLSSLVGALSLLKRGRIPEDKMADLLELSLAQARRQDDMIRQVLEVFSAEMNELESIETNPRLAPNLVSVVEDALQRILPAYDAADVKLSLICEPTFLPIVGRLDRLERIVANLLDNALRYSPPHSEVRLEVEQVTESMACLTVSDLGPGVPPEFQEKLFQRFSQGRSSQAGSAGLGLYFCHITLAAWGGSIRYRDRQGGGASFDVHLRLA